MSSERTCHVTSSSSTWDAHTHIYIYRATVRDFRLAGLATWQLGLDSLSSIERTWNYHWLRSRHGCCRGWMPVVKRGAWGQVEGFSIPSLQVIKRSVLLIWAVLNQGPLLPCRLYFRDRVNHSKKGENSERDALQRWSKQFTSGDSVWIDDLYRLNSTLPYSRPKV